MSPKTNKGPVDAVVALTYRCNLRCVTCDLPERETEERLTPETLRKLPPSLRYVNLTGGEPLLVADLVPRVRAVYDATGAQITISTNGTLPERAEEVVRELSGDVRGFHVAVSLDGLEATHDRVRQAPGSFKKALETVGRLAPLLGPDLHLAFTISAANADEFGCVAKLAAEYRLPLSLALTHTSEHYFKPRDGAVPGREAALRAVEAAAGYYLRRFTPGGAARAYFAAGLREVVVRRRRPLPCRAGDEFFYLDPAADVYLCNMRAEKVGNLDRESFERIWGGDARRTLLATTGRECPVQCWMVCTARTAIIGHPLRVGCWAAAAYARKMLGLPLVKKG